MGIDFVEPGKTKIDVPICVDDRPIDPKYVQSPESAKTESGVQSCVYECKHEWITNDYRENVVFCRLCGRGTP